MDREGGMEVEELTAVPGHAQSLPDIEDPIVCLTLDIASYTCRYDGYTKLARLQFIAKRCKNLQEEAYRTLMNELKKGSNTQFYSRLCETIGDSLGPDFTLDVDWIEKTERKSSQKIERIEAELLAAKTTMVKESIRLGYNDLGDFHYERGNLDEALKSYIRTRDYCTMPRHNAEMCIRVINVSIDLLQIRNVSNYVSKAGNAITEPVFRSKLKAAAGLVAIAEGQYKLAARNFLEVEPDLSESFSTVIAAEDVAMYGTLCSLATLDRPSVRKALIEAPNFKCFLELTPEIKLLVQNFLSGKYGECLLFLDTIKPQLLLDIHLSKHAERLVAEILERMILLYFSPYSVVDMNKMAAAFSMDLARLEKLVAGLISKDRVSARIDSQKKTIHRRQHDVRSIAINKVLNLSQKNLNEVKRGVLRLSVMQCNFYVSPRDAPTTSRGAGGNSSSGGGGGGAGAGANAGDDSQDSRGRGGGYSMGESTSSYRSSIEAIMEVVEGNSRTPTREPPEDMYEERSDVEDI
jgi:COP9 signalosome complex subunit 1